MSSSWYAFPNPLGPCNAGVVSGSQGREGTRTLFSECQGSVHWLVASSDHRRADREVGSRHGSTQPLVEVASRDSKETICCPQSPFIVPFSLFGWVRTGHFTLEFCFCFVFLSMPVACEILVSWPGIKPGPSAGKAESLRLNCQEIPKDGDIWKQPHIQGNLESHCTCPRKDIESQRGPEKTLNLYLRLIPSTEIPCNNYFIFYIYLLFGCAGS